MAGRRIFNEQDARRCLAVRSSRSALGEWARAHGIDGRSLNAWRVNLAAHDVPQSRAVASKFVELVPAASLPLAGRTCCTLPASSSRSATTSMSSRSAASSVCSSRAELRARRSRLRRGRAHRHEG